jgi:hypothetical protein
MIAALLNLVWGLVVLLSFVALGRIMARVVRPAGSWDLSMAAAWGMAGMVALGAWLNLLGVAQASVLMALVLTVIAVDLLYEGRKFLRIAENPPTPPGGPTERGKWFWLVLLALLITFKYATSLGWHFNPYDDQPAYMVELSRLLQTGSIGRDPFNYRQMLSLNGQTFLLGLVGSVSPLKYGLLLDPGICWIMIAGLTWSFIRRDLGGSIRDSCLATGLVLMVKIAPGSNLGGNLTGTVLYLTMFRMAYGSCGDEGRLNRGSFFLLACTVAALCALKTTFLFYAILFLVSWYGLRMLHSHRLALVRELSLVGLLTFALLLPWMWQQYLSSGTPLYPLLGHGYHQSGNGAAQFGDSVKDKAMAVIDFLPTREAAPLIFGLLLLACDPWEDRWRWRVFFASTFSILIGSLVLSFLFVSSSTYRYVHPVHYAGLIPLGLYGLFLRRSSMAGTGLALCLAIFVGTQWEDLRLSAANFRDFLRAGSYGFLVRDQDVQQIRSAQALIPQGKQILSYVHDGYVLDLARNPTWILDYPGMVSPPPGLPVTTDPAAFRGFIMQRTTAFPSPSTSRQMRDYLRHIGIDFLLLQRGRWDRQGIPDHPFFERVACLNMRLVQAQLLELMSKCQKRYDDGAIVALDLSVLLQQPE